MHIIPGYVHIISIVIAYELAGRYFIIGIVTFFSYGNEIRVISKFEEHLEWFQYVFQNLMRIFFGISEKIVKIVKTLEYS